MVVSPQEPEEPGKVVSVVLLAVHEFVGVDHGNEVAHDVGEDHDPHHQDDRAADSLRVGLGMEVSKAHSAKRCNTEVDRNNSLSCSTLVGYIILGVESRLVLRRIFILNVNEK
jgi:hypothetical protein